jgi:hypothetical protein
MKKTGFLMTIAALSIAGMMFGCSKAPQKELSAAKAILDSAAVMEADKYMPAEFSAAQDSLNAAMIEIEKQKSANLLARNYDRAKSLILSASIAARHAQIQAPEEKRKVKAAVDTLLAQASAKVGEANALLAKAPKGKEGKAALEAIGNDISTVKASLADAQALSDKGDLVSARDKANAGISKLDSIKAELTTAIEKTSSKSKSKSKKK